MLHVFFSLRRSQQPELPRSPHYTLPVCRPAFCGDLRRHPLGPPQSVDTLWLDAGAHSVLEVEIWAGRTGEYRRLLVRQYVVHTWAGVRGEFSDECLFLGH